MSVLPGHSDSLSRAALNSKFQEILNLILDPNQILTKRESTLIRNTAKKTKSHLRLLGRISLAISLVLLITLLNVATGYAQNPASTLETLQVELWPDFDQPSVLVLLTGTLPTGTDLPATVTIPLPPEATINAAARIDGLGDFYSIDYDDSIPGQVTMVVPDSTFRLEYYAPYSADGNQRSFSYDWQFDFDVEEISASVQQPSRASAISVSPEPTSVNSGQYDLTYHILPTRAVPAGTTYRIEADYELVRPELSATVIDVQQSNTVSSLEPETSTSIIPDDGFNWLLVLAVAGIGLAGAAAVWFVVSNNRNRRRVVKPRPARRSKKGQARPSASSKTAGVAKFCHECGEPAGAGDKFCRNCGTVLKTD